MTENINMILEIVVFFLICLSGFFSMSETAITNCSAAKIHRLTKEGSKRAKIAERLIRNSEGAISTILLCNNAVNILASAIATSVLIKIFGETGVIYATIIMTILILVFAEITPKTYALKHSEKITLFIAPILTILIKIFYPITKGIKNTIDMVFGFFGSPQTEKRKLRLLSDLDEIRGTIELKHKAGSIVKDDKDMLDSILDLDATEIMNVIIHRSNIESINVNQSLDQIIKKAFTINHSRIPLWRDNEDNIVAILNMRKLFTALHKNQGDIKKINLDKFTTKPWFVPSSNSLKNQLISFKQKREKFALVIDEYSALMGIITLEDILEEIVGEIDEQSQSQTKLKIRELKDGGYRISGDYPVRDINRKLGWNLPEDDDKAATLAGLLISRSEKIPNEGEEFKFDGFKFSVFKVRQNRVTSIKVTKI